MTSDSPPADAVEAGAEGDPWNDPHVATAVLSAAHAAGTVAWPDEVLDARLDAEGWEREARHWESEYRKALHVIADLLTGDPRVARSARAFLARTEGDK